MALLARAAAVVPDAAQQQQVQWAGHAGGGAAGDAPALAPEQGLVDAALLCLAHSPQRQQAFAQQLVQQLQQVADALSRQQPGGASTPFATTAVEVRLGLLLPLLPRVYVDRAPDTSKSLRGQLLAALVALLGCPALLAACANGDGPAAGEPLPQRLLHLLHALNKGGWASWMRPEGEVGPKATRCNVWRGERVACCQPGGAARGPPPRPWGSHAVPTAALPSPPRAAGRQIREIPPYEHSARLAAELAALPLAPRVLAAAMGAMPHPPPAPLLEVAALDGGTTGARVDPWLLLEGGVAAPDSSGGLPHWLQAVRRRRRPLAYGPPDS